jgi:hypothetical protein
MQYEEQTDLVIRGQVLTVSYHATIRKMRVSRELSPAMYLLCLASFCSMLGLLFEIHVCSVIH